MQNQETHMAIGDWVKGKTKNGELIRGFIVAWSPNQDTTKVYVIDCDHEVTIGRTVETLTRWVRRIPDSSFYNEEQLKELIDVALFTRDEPWFKELCERLSTIRKSSVQPVRAIQKAPSFQNRLGSNNQ